MCILSAPDLVDICIEATLLARNTQMKPFKIPSRNQVSPENQILFDSLANSAGHVPNLLAAMASSDTALKNYLALERGETSFDSRELEVINLVVSQVNNCLYCLSTHTMIAILNGFTHEQIKQIRIAEIPFDDKLDALAKAAKNITENKGKINEMVVRDFYRAGYNEGNLIDLAIAVGNRIMSNYTYALTEVPIDFPIAQEI